MKISKIKEQIGACVDLLDNEWERSRKAENYDREDKVIKALYLANEAYKALRGVE